MCNKIAIKIYLNKEFREITNQLEFSYSLFQKEDVYETLVTN